jgi:hypothetical protein
MCKVLGLIPGTEIKKKDILKRPAREEASIVIPNFPTRKADPSPQQLHW